MPRLPTMHGYRQTVDSYLRPHLGDEPLSELDRRRLERLYARLLTSGGVNGKPLSPRTVQRTHAVLHRALRGAQLDGLLERNPAALARTPKRDPREVETDDDLQVWTAEEATRFPDLVDDHPWRVLWHLALGTGARRGELLGHTTISMTMDIYAHILPAMDQDAADRINPSHCCADAWGTDECCSTTRIDPSTHSCQPNGRADCCS